MSKVYLFLADGNEEIEALTVVDLLRRAGVELTTVSIGSHKKVTGSHNISYYADITLDEAKDTVDILVLPGGMPGTKYLGESEKLMDMVKKQYEEGRYVAAICAAPTLFGNLGILEDKKATCYPGMMDKLIAKEKLTDSVVVDGNVITSRGLGTAIDFSLKMIELLISKEKADEIGASVVYKA